MKPKSAKAKGSRLEREIARDLREKGLDKNASRMPLSGAIENFKSDINTSLPLHIECKCQETWKPLEYMKQAEAGAKKHEIPLVIMSRNRMVDPLVLIGWQHFLNILGDALKGGGLKPEYGYSKNKQLKKG